jgi:hypothetical protein
MNNILALAGKLPSFNIQGSVGWPYNVTAGYIGKTSYVLPVNLAANATKLHQELFLQEDYVPSALLNSISAELAARIQAARDAQEIENEEDVEIEETEDPTQVPDDSVIDDPDINPETGLPWDPADPNSPNYDPTLTDPENPDDQLGEGDGTDSSVPDDTVTDPTVPETPTDQEGDVTVQPSEPGNIGDSSDVPADSDEIQDDPDEEIVYDDPDEQVVNTQDT